MSPSVATGAKRSSFRRRLSSLSEFPENRTGKGEKPIWASCLMPDARSRAPDRRSLAPGRSTPDRGPRPRPMPTGALPRASIPATAGPGICGRDGLGRSSWMKPSVACDRHYLPQPGPRRPCHAPGISPAFSIRIGMTPSSTPCGRRKVLDARSASEVFTRLVAEAIATDQQCCASD